MNYDENIGTNIRIVRLEKGLSQQEVADRCGVQNTVISAYENGKRTPALQTIASIAHALGVSIDRLYYGDEDEGFIIREPDEGRRVVNAVYYLWKQSVITDCEEYNSYSYVNNGGGDCSDKLVIRKYADSIKRLLNALEDFKERKNTFDEPDKYLEMILKSSAKEINGRIHGDELLFY